MDAHTTAKQDNTDFFHGLHDEFWKLKVAVMSTRPTFEIVQQSQESKHVELSPINVAGGPSSNGGVHYDKKGEGRKGIDCPR